MRSAWIRHSELTPSLGTTDVQWARLSGAALAVLCGLAGASPAWAQDGAFTPVACAAPVNARHREPDSGVDSPGRRAVLAKGVNYTDGFDASVPSSVRRRDFETLRQLGIRHIRVPVNPAAITAWDQAAPDRYVSRLDEIVCQATSAGLAVIIDIHPEDPFVLRDQGQPRALDRLTAAWDWLAQRYRVFTPDLMLFEALNEPTLHDPKRWDQAQRTLLAHIRRQAPQHTVLLTATPDSTAGALSGSKPVDDGNVAYVFHFYSPMQFTHQGADWASEELGSIKRLMYPAETDNVASVRHNAVAAADVSLSKFLRYYASLNGIAGEIDMAAHWAADHHVPLVVTEFGVYNSVTPPVARANWLRDVRRTLEARGIGWTVWEYRGGFGIDADLRRMCGGKTSIRSALGLCKTTGN